MATIVIKLAGVDITNDVEISSAMFSMQVNGSPGSCSIRIKDMGHDYEPVTGKVITLDIDGVRQFVGYATRITRTYAFDVDNTAAPLTTPRFLTLEGVDINVLLSKRVVYYKLEPNLGPLRPPEALQCSAEKSDMWATNTPAKDIVEYVFDNYTDFGGDGITYDIKDFGSPNPDACRTYSASQTFDSFMQGINQFLNGVYYIGPDEVFYYHDALVAPSAYSLTDSPDPESPDPYKIQARKITILSDATDMVNDAFVWGTAQGWDKVTFSRYQDNIDVSTVDGTILSSITDHGRWQKSAYPTIYQQTTADTIAESMVNGFGEIQYGAKWDKIVVRTTVYEPVFNLGDWVDMEFWTWSGPLHSPFDAPYGNGLGTGPLQISLPLRRKEISFATNNDPVYSLTFIQQVDNPYSAYEFLFNPSKIELPPIKINVPVIEELKATSLHCSITDTFTREVPVGWGVSDAGFIWTQLFGNSNQSLSVTNGKAYIQPKGPTAAETVYFCLDNLGNPRDENGSFKMTFDFSFNGPKSKEVGGIFYVEFQSSPSEVLFRFWPHEKKIYFRQSGVGAPDIPFSFDFIANTEYKIRFEYPSSGNLGYFKIWPLNSPEPSGWTMIWPSYLIFNQFQFFSTLWFGDYFCFDNLDIAGISICTIDNFENRYIPPTASGWPPYPNLANWGLASSEISTWEQLNVSKGSTVSVIGGKGIFDIDHSVPEPGIGGKYNGQMLPLDPTLKGRHYRFDFQTIKTSGANIGYRPHIIVEGINYSNDRRLPPREPFVPWFFEYYMDTSECILSSDDTSPLTSGYPLKLSVFLPTNYYQVHHVHIWYTGNVGSQYITCNAAIWADGQPEPEEPMLYFTTSVGSANYPWAIDTIEVHVDTNFESVKSITYFDNLKITGSNGDPITEQAFPPLYGMVGNSVILWRNGIVQRNGIDFLIDPETNLITLTSPYLETDTFKVMYWKEKVIVG